MFAPMDGLMMDRPLLIRDIAERVERLFPQREIVSRTHTGVERSTYGEVVARARRLASSLERLGVRRGDRVATFGWNSRRHLELYLAVPSMGAVLHTLNIRLFEDDLRYIVGHAQDRVIFLDASLADVMPRFDGVEHEVLMPDADGERDGALDYEQLIDEGDEGFAFPDLDERSAAAMCYTSGTTGRPKGVLYSHRSTILHTIGANQADGLALSRGFEEKFGVPIVQAWGMTETSPVASVSRPGPDGPEDEDGRYGLRATVGRVLPLVDFRIDEEAGGELLVRGPWVASAYYEDDSQKEKFEGGWLRTGDVAELADGCFIKIVDRTKDLVKSGG